MLFEFCTSLVIQALGLYATCLNVGVTQDMGAEQYSICPRALDEAFVCLNFGA